MCLILVTHRVAVARLIIIKLMPRGLLAPATFELEQARDHGVQIMANERSGAGLQFPNNASGVRDVPASLCLIVVVEHTREAIKTQAIKAQTHVPQTHVPQSARVGDM